MKTTLLTPFFLLIVGLSLIVNSKPFFHLVFALSTSTPTATSGPPTSTYTPAPTATNTPTTTLMPLPPITLIFPARTDTSTPTITPVEITKIETDYPSLDDVEENIPPRLRILSIVIVLIWILLAGYLMIYIRQLF